MPNLLFDSDLLLRIIPLIADNGVAVRLTEDYRQSIRSRMHQIDDRDRSCGCCQPSNLQRLN